MNNINVFETHEQFVEDVRETLLKSGFNEDNHISIEILIYQLTGEDRNLSSLLNGAMVHSKEKGLDCIADTLHDAFVFANPYRDRKTGVNNTYLEFVLMDLGSTDGTKVTYTLVGNTLVGTEETFKVPDWLEETVWYPIKTATLDEFLGYKVIDLYSPEGDEMTQDEMTEENQTPVGKRVDPVFEQTLTGKLNEQSWRRKEFEKQERDLFELLRTNPFNNEEKFTIHRYVNTERAKRSNFLFDSGPTPENCHNGYLVNHLLDEFRNKLMEHFGINDMVEFVEKGHNEKGYMYVSCRYTDQLTDVPIQTTYLVPIVFDAETGKRALDETLCFNSMTTYLQTGIKYSLGNEIEISMRIAAEGIATAVIKLDEMYRVSEVTWK